MKKLAALLPALALLAALAAGCAAPQSAGISGTGMPGAEDEEVQSMAPQPLRKKKGRELELGQGLFSFSFEANGEVYALPFPVADLLRNGWQCAVALEDEGLEAGEYIKTVFSKGGLRFTAGLANQGKGRAAASAATVFEAAFSQGGFLLPGGISHGSARSLVLEEYGMPDSGQSAGEELLSYTRSKGRFAQISFDGKDGVSQILLHATSPSPVFDWEGVKLPGIASGWQRPLELPGAGEWQSMVFELGGAMYTLPAPVKAFMDEGWVFANEEKALMPVKAGGFVVAIYLQKGAQKMRVNLENPSDGELVCAACLVTLVQSSPNGPDVPIRLAGGVDMQTGSARLKELYGNKFTSAAAGGLTRIFYHGEAGMMRFDYENFAKEGERLVYIQLTSKP